MNETFLERLGLILFITHVQLLNNPEPIHQCHICISCSVIVTLFHACVAKDAENLQNLSKFQEKSKRPARSWDDGLSPHLLFLDRSRMSMYVHND